MRVCACGCGEPIEQVVRKGRVAKWRPGHNFKTQEIACKTTYRRVANGKASTIQVHRLLAERALGHALPVGAIVHHVDGTRDSKSPLVICQDKAYHNSLHLRMRIVALGGNPWTERFCGWCKTLKPIADFKKAESLTKCKTCYSRYEKARVRRQSA